MIGKEGDGFGDGHLEHVGHALAAPLKGQDLRPVALAVAVRAAQIHIRQKLHLDVLEARAAGRWGSARAGVEAERARRCSRARWACGKAANSSRTASQAPDVADRVGARGLADRALVDEHHAGEVLGTEQAVVLAGRSVAWPKWRASAGASTSWISVDLPEPLTRR